MVKYRDPQLDAVYGAISHPVRRSVLDRLRPGSATVTQLASHYPISLVAVSKHIRVLESAGLVRRTVEGREHHLALEPATLLPAAGWLDTYRRFWDARLDLLGARIPGPKATVSGADAVEIQRRLPAAVGEVFRWWTDPQRLQEWMSPVGTVEAEVDLRVGGTIRIVMKGDDQEIEHHGTYLEIQPPRRLVFTWRSPFTGPQPSLVTVELEADGDDATWLHLVHQQLPDASTESHRGGWGSMLDRLGRELRQAADVIHGG